MIPIEELEKVLRGCISRTLKHVGRKEFIDLFNYLDKANELNATQASRIAELEAAIRNNAPHGSFCSSLRKEIQAYACDCWKRTALKTEE